ncbi:MAG: tRNA pseudouridine(38-40) synthase TruA, partial [Gemmatimonadota bacterium]|nr:tRNA pseudouridine(38-40) synthase TruA [Gemmatimonadota bacterium]
MMGESDTRFRLTLHYDGSAFHGWQIQPRDRTVQGELEAVIKRLTGTRRPVDASGRTDAGVHARGQVAAVTLPARWTAPALEKSLNALLPDDVWVASVSEARGDFHPRFDAVDRTYRYQVGTDPAARSPFQRRWCWPLGEPLDTSRLDSCAALLEGEGHFESFARSGQPDRGYACHIHEARWAPWEFGVCFTITANRYLHHMVRYLVGTMVDVGRRRRLPDDFEDLLANRSGVETSPPAPPGGLFLDHVRYPDDVELLTNEEDRPSGRPKGTGSPVDRAPWPGGRPVQKRTMIGAGLLVALLGAQACTVESIPRDASDGSERPTIVQRPTDARSISV